MICFQQAACSFLKNYKENQNQAQMVKHETRLRKYLDRMYDIVQCRYKQHNTMTKNQIFRELNKVVQCQLVLNMNDEATQLEKLIKNSN